MEGTGLSPSLIYSVHYLSRCQKLYHWVSLHWWMGQHIEGQEAWKCPHQDLVTTWHCSYLLLSIQQYFRQWRLEKKCRVSGFCISRRKKERKTSNFPGQPIWKEWRRLRNTSCFETQKRRNLIGQTGKMTRQHTKRHLWLSFWCQGNFRQGYSMSEVEMEERLSCSSHMTHHKASRNFTNELRGTVVPDQPVLV